MKNIKCPKCGSKNYDVAESHRLSVYHSFIDGVCVDVTRGNSSLVSHTGSARCAKCGHEWGIRDFNAKMLEANSDMAKD